MNGGTSKAAAPAQVAPVVDPFRTELSATPEVKPVASPSPGPEPGASDAPPVRDEASVPPVGDWDSPFFSNAGDARGDDGDILDDGSDPRAARYALFAAAAERRAHLARYVVGAMSLCSALCVVALAKAAIFGLGGSTVGRATAATAAAIAIAAPTPSDRGDAPVASVAAVEIHNAEVAPAEAPPATATAAEPVASIAPVTPVAPAEPQAAAAGTAATATPEPAPAPAAPVAPEPVQSAPSPKEETTAAESPDAEREEAKARETSRSALESNRIGVAVEAGERAVKLDPTDGEAWLILGAAYQQRGDPTNARRCYRACVAQGRRGPRNECAQMLR